MLLKPVVLCLALPVLPVAADPLKLNDRAPPLQGVRWLRAGPIAAYEENRTYLLTFWGRKGNKWALPS